MNPEDIVRISQLAGDEILKIYNQKENLQISHKDDNSPLTDADLAEHNTIVKALAELTPDITILSEYAANISWQVRQAWPR